MRYARPNAPQHSRRHWRALILSGYRSQPALYAHRVARRSPQVKPAALPCRSRVALAALLSRSRVIFILFALPPYRSLPR